MVQARKKIAILHRYPKEKIFEVSPSFPSLLRDGVDVLTFKKFNRLHNGYKLIKSFLWIFYAPFLVMGKGYDLIYCDDSFPFYPALVKLASPRSKVVVRMGDFHLMYYISGIPYHILHWFEVLSWKIVDEIIAISLPMADRIFEESGKKCHVAVDAVDPVNFPIIESVKKSNRLVMFHGMLIKNKGVDVLLAAAERLPDIDFTVVGDGPDRERLEGLAPDNVTFTGWVPFHRIVWILNSCTIGVSLRTDNPGNDYVVTSPFLQYSVLAKPCLVTKRKVFGDYPWQFTGVDDLVHGINELMDRPDEGERMRQHILEHHNAKKVGDEIWNLLCQFVS
jgi:glycosyltransferase involved in cell wall biosynthesis